MLPAPARPPGAAIGGKGFRVTAAAAAAANAKKKKKRVLKIESDNLPEPAPAPILPSEAAPNKRSILEAVLTPSDILDATMVAKNDLDFKYRLRRFFSFYDPSQLPIVDSWMANWAGREQELLRELIWYHGPEPPKLVPTEAIEGFKLQSPQSTQIQRVRSLLLNFLSFYAPERLAQADSILAAWDGHEDLFLERLERQARVRDFILQYYSGTWPDRMFEAVTVAQEWLGVEGELLKMLPKAPVGPVAYVVNPDKPALKSRRSLSARHQVRQFFKVYKPEHLGEVDAIMEAFEGREDWLLMSLRRQYLGDTDITTMLDHSFLKPEMKAAFRTLCAHWNPEACEELEELFWQFRGTEEEFILHMCSLGRKSESTYEAKKPIALLPPSHRSVGTISSPAHSTQNSAVLMPALNPTQITRSTNLPPQVAAPASSELPIDSAVKAEVVPMKSAPAAPVETSTEKGSPDPPPAEVNVPYPDFQPVMIARPAKVQRYVPNPLDVFHASSQLVPSPRASSVAMPIPVLNNNWNLSDALAAIGASALYSLCLQEELDVELFCRLSQNDLRSLGVTDPNLLSAPSRLAKLNLYS